MSAIRSPARRQLSADCQAPHDAVAYSPEKSAAVAHSCLSGAYPCLRRMRLTRIRSIAIVRATLVDKLGARPMGVATGASFLLTIAGDCPCATPVVVTPVEINAARIIS